MQPVLIDTHSHIYLKHFDNDIDAAIARCAANGINKIFLPAIDHETNDRLIALSERKLNSPVEILPMMGVHPCSINDKFEDELKIALSLLDSGKKYYAVGEIGLDYYWDKTFVAQQVIAFEKQIEWAIERDLPIVIHSRESTGDCIKSVAKYAGKVKGIFHCFSGTLDEAKQIIDLGFYLGIGGVVTYKNGGLKEIMPEVGLENIVLETDSPYLAPVPHRGKRNESSYIKIIAEAVATATNTPFEKVAQITTANALKVFKVQ